MPFVRTASTDFQRERRDTDVFALRKRETLSSIIPGRFGTTNAFYYGHIWTSKLHNMPPLPPKSNKRSDKMPGCGMPGPRDGRLAAKSRDGRQNVWKRFSNIVESEEIRKIGTGPVTRPRDVIVKTVTIAFFFFFFMLFAINCRIILYMYKRLFFRRSEIQWGQWRQSPSVYIFSHRPDKIETFQFDVTGWRRWCNSDFLGSATAIFKNNILGVPRRHINPIVIFPEIVKIIEFCFFLLIYDSRGLRATNICISSKFICFW